MCEHVQWIPHGMVAHMGGRRRGAGGHVGPPLQRILSRGVVVQPYASGGHVGPPLQTHFITWCCGSTICIGRPRGAAATWGGRPRGAGGHAGPPLQRILSRGFVVQPYTSGGHVGRAATWGGRPRGLQLMICADDRFNVTFPFTERTYITSSNIVVEGCYETRLKI